MVVWSVFLVVAKSFALDSVWIGSFGIKGMLSLVVRPVDEVTGSEVDKKVIAVRYLGIEENDDWPDVERTPSPVPPPPLLPPPPLEMSVPPPKHSSPKSLLLRPLMVNLQARFILLACKSFMPFLILFVDRRFWIILL